jgi:hypothetical protein
VGSKGLEVQLLKVLLKAVLINKLFIQEYYVPVLLSLFDLIIHACTNMIRGGVACLCASFGRPVG